MNSPVIPDMSGVWVSTYRYFSSSRDKTFENSRYVVLSQNGADLTIDSLASPNEGNIHMKLAYTGTTVQGVWEEVTSPESYYQGATYRGAIQLLVTPSLRRLVGKWVGHGRDFEINTGDWEFVFKDPSTTPETLERYTGINSNEIEHA